jgi:RHS repeat-associated protein
VDQPLVLQKAGVGFFYYHSNHQGSIMHLTDNSGTVANSYVYDSYGRRLNVTESVIQPFSYTGREFDVESGLYFYRARYFDAQTGRFLSEDPIGFVGEDENLYRYVGNNPVNFIDPDGEKTVPNPGSFNPFEFLAGVAAGFLESASGTGTGDVSTGRGTFDAGRTLGSAGEEAIRKSASDPNFKEPGCRGGICNKDVWENRQPAPQDDPPPCP